MVDTPGGSGLLGSQVVSVLIGGSLIGSWGILDALLLWLRRLVGGDVFLDG